jgi:hypothetical protein
VKTLAEQWRALAYADQRAVLRHLILAQQDTADSAMRARENGEGLWTQRQAAFQLAIDILSRLMETSP